MLVQITHGNTTKQLKINIGRMKAYEGENRYIVTYTQGDEYLTIHLDERDRKNLKVLLDLYEKEER